MKWLGLIFLASVVSSLPAEKERAFSLFSVVTFANDQCTSQDTTTTTGICQTVTECSDNGGASSGNCASGFGVCCLYTVSECSSSAVEVKNNVTHLVNPGFPSTFSTASQTCSFKVVGSSSICQLRLDFTKVVVAGPSSTGTCGTANDEFSVTAPGSTGAQGFRTLCGTLTGSHMYIETAMADTAATINVVTGTDSTTARSWNIMVRMIECDNLGRAPTDCLQYYTGSAGVVNSFNAVSGMIVNQNYQACIRKEAGMCSIDYREATTGTPDAFGLIGAATSPAVANVGTKCATNYIAVQSSAVTGTLDRYCGGLLSDKEGETVTAVITSTAKNFGINVFSNAVAAISSEIGFKLAYSQVPC